jgi:hypothetical protein
MIKIRGDPFTAAGVARQEAVSAYAAPGALDMELPSVYFHVGFPPQDEKP